MRVEKFVQRQNLLLKYTRTLVTSETIGLNRRRRRDVEEHHWHCCILYKLFDFPVMVEKKIKDELLLTSVAELKIAAKTRRESRLELIRQIRGRKMVIKELAGTRTLAIPEDLT